MDRLPTIYRRLPANLWSKFEEKKSAKILFKLETQFQISLLKNRIISSSKFNSQPRSIAV
jgi:hypothetical protein